MSSEENKEIVRRIMLEIISRGDYELADELIAVDVVARPLREGQAPGLEGWKSGLRMVRSAFSDWESVPSKFVCEGDTVAVRWTVGGTHTGVFAGIPATGQRVSMNEMGFFRISGGKLIEYESIADEISLLRQLGVLPSPGAGDPH